MIPFLLSRASSNPSQQDASPSQWSTNAKKYIQEVETNCEICIEQIFHLLWRQAKYMKYWEETNYWHKGTMVIGCFFRSIFFGLPASHSDNDITPPVAISNVIICTNKNQTIVSCHDVSYASRCTYARMCWKLHWEHRSKLGAQYKMFQKLFFLPYPTIPYNSNKTSTPKLHKGIPAPSSSSSTNLSEYHRISTSSCSALSHRNATTQTLNTPCPRVPLKLFLSLFEFVLVRWSDRTEATKYLWSWMAETVT